MNTEDRIPVPHNITESELEGVRYAIYDQLHEHVLPYLSENNIIIYDRQNPIYKEYLQIKVDVDKLIKILYDNSLPEFKKYMDIQFKIDILYNRTKELVSLVNEKVNNEL